MRLGGEHVEGALFAAHFFPESPIPYVQDFAQLYRDAFGSEPGVDVLISFTATLPALFVAALAALFGLLGDRVGHKRVLFATTLLYGIVGTAPVWQATLSGIVFSRALVGVAEAAIRMPSYGAPSG